MLNTKKNLFRFLLKSIVFFALFQSVKVEKTYAEKTQLNDNYLAQIYEKESLTKAEIDSVNQILSSKLTLTYQVIDDLFIKNINSSKEINYDAGLAKSYFNYGIYLLNKGKYENAIEVLIQSLKIYEKLKKENEVADVKNQLVRVYIGLSENINPGLNKALAGDVTIDKEKQQVIEKAEQFCHSAIQYNQANTRLVELASNYNNLGIIKQKKLEIDSAGFYFNESLKIYNKLNDKLNVAKILNNLGIVYENLGNFEAEKRAYALSLELFEDIKDSAGIALSNNNIANVFLGSGDCKNGLVYAEKGYKIAHQINNLPVKKDLLFTLYSLHKCLDNCNLKSFYFERYIEVKDSIFNIESKRILDDVNAQYETEKKETQIQLLLKNKALDSTIKLTLVVGLILTLLLIIVVFRSNRQKNKANALLDQQKKRIEIQNVSITDSINYAQRIQFALLPTMDEIHEAFKNTFIIFKPKDIVSGDFYWFHETESSYYIAAVDCTGHGVPGSLMSLLGGETLKEALKEKESPGEILQLTNQLLKHTLRQENEDASTRDGMDIALCRLIKNTNEIYFSAANRPLWIIRNGTRELKVVKPTKAAIGGLTPLNQEFENHKLSMHAGDTIFMFTDGFADQFGSDDKKLKIRRFKELLVSCIDEDIPKIKTILEAFIGDWKGETEQTDDILVMGIRF